MRRSKMKIFDNGGETFDRYTVVFTDVKETRDSFYALGMSENPYHPQGFGLHCDAIPGDHLGKEIEFLDLPYDCKRMVENEFVNTTLDKILNWVFSKYGAPMGRPDIGTKPEDVRVFDCAVPLNSGGYDKGGAYWGIGYQLRVEYTKDLKFVRFYRK